MRIFRHKIEHYFRSTIWRRIINNQNMNLWHYLENFKKQNRNIFLFVIRRNKNNMLGQFQRFTFTKIHTSQQKFEVRFHSRLVLTKRKKNFPVWYTFFQLILLFCYTGYRLA